MDGMLVVVLALTLIALVFALAAALYFPIAVLAGKYNPATAIGAAWAALVGAIFLAMFALGYAAAFAVAAGQRKRKARRGPCGEKLRERDAEDARSVEMPLTIDKFSEIARATCR